jgi:hypothetical protein
MKNFMGCEGTPPTFAGWYDEHSDILFMRDLENLVLCDRKDVHGFRLWIDLLDDTLNRRLDFDADDLFDGDLPEDIYKNENVE